MERSGRERYCEGMTGRDQGWEESEEKRQRPVARRPEGLAC